MTESAGRETQQIYEISKARKCVKGGSRTLQSYYLFDRQGTADQKQIIEVSRRSILPRSVFCAPRIRDEISSRS